MSFDSGSDGSPSYTPSIFERIISTSISIIVAINPDSSSLSVNISSVTDTVSFSLTIGMTPASSITRMQLRWFR